jgi:hypothetical protein
LAIKTLRLRDTKMFLPFWMNHETSTFQIIIDHMYSILPQIRPTESAAKRGSALPIHLHPYPWAPGTAATGCCGQLLGAARWSRVLGPLRSSDRGRFFFRKAHGTGWSQIENHDVVGHFFCHRSWGWSRRGRLGVWSPMFRSKT